MRTSGIGDAVSALGDTVGGFGGDVLDFLGDFLGGQQSTQGQVSENNLAGILAREAADRYIADKMYESQENILDFQRDQYDDAIARLQPFYDMGVTQAQEVLPDYIDAAKRDIEYVDIDPFDADDPALRFLQDEARRAIENSAAARGRLKHWRHTDRPARPVSEHCPGESRGAGWYPRQDEPRRKAPRQVRL